MPNCTIAEPFKVILSYTKSSRFYNAMNCLYPAIECLAAPVLIIIPMNLVNKYQVLESDIYILV